MKMKIVAMSVLAIPPTIEQGRVTSSNKNGSLLCKSCCREHAPCCRTSWANYYPQYWNMKIKHWCWRHIHMNSRC